MSNCFDIASQVPADVAQVWARAATAHGINAELGPWLRMTAPAGYREIDPASFPLGRRAFRSWVLLLSVLPVEYDDLTLVELEPGHRFLERSSTATLRVWQHERVLTARDGGCLVEDHLSFTPRRGVPAAIARRVVRMLFTHRHRRLRALYGAPVEQEAAA